MIGRVAKKKRIAKSKSWRKKHLLSLLLVPVFLGVFCLAYLTQIGLPPVLKGKIVSELHDLGLKADFDSIHLDLTRGIVIRSVEMEHEATFQFPFELTIQEAILDVSVKNWNSLKLKVESLTIVSGNLEMPLDSDPDASIPFELGRIGSKISFQDDEWKLEHFTTRVEGIPLQISGKIVNASQLSKMPKFRFGPSHPESGNPVVRFRKGMQKALNGIKKGINHFDLPVQPEIEVQFILNPLDLNQCHTTFLFVVPQALTKGVNLKDITMKIQLDMPEANRISGVVDVTVNEVESKQISLRTGIFTCRFEQEIDQATPEECSWNLTAHDLTSGKYSVTEMKLEGSSIPYKDSQYQDAIVSGQFRKVTSPYGFIPFANLDTEIRHQWTFTDLQSARLNLRVPDISTPWGNAHNTSLVLDPLLESSFFKAHEPLPLRGWWNKLARFPCVVDLQTESISGDILSLKNGNLKASINLPDIVLEKFQAELYDGTLDVTGSLDVDTRFCQAEVVSHFDWHQLKPFLNEKGRTWISQYGWESPPLVKGTAELQFPPWGIENPDWPEQFRKTLKIVSSFKAGKGSFRTVPILEAQGRILRNDAKWILPDLRVKRPEGSILLQHQYNVLNKEFTWRFDGSIFPEATLPLFEWDARTVMDRFDFSKPIRASGEAVGFSNSPEKLGIKARLEMANFKYKGEPFDQLNTFITYTNQVIELRDAELKVEDETLNSNHLSVSMDQGEIQVHHLEGSIYPGRIGRAIGEKIGRSFEPYQFLQPPQLFAEGMIHYRDPSQSDFHVQLEPVDFSWWKFQFEEMKGTVDWTGNQLLLSNMQSSFYEGALKGNYRFEFSDDEPAELAFNTELENVRIKEMLSDLMDKPSENEGVIHASIEVQSGITSDLHSWVGKGGFSLKEGKLWNFPLFSILTPLLELIAPGLGSSRGAEAGGLFTFEDGNIHSDQIEVQEKMFTLKFKGDVDIKGNLDARVQADILRETWLVGKAVSTALSPVSRVFEYRISGTLGDPAMQPIHLVPRMFLAPLQPFKLIRNLFKKQEP